MANFSSFFPAAAAGGGGFTKMKKITTFRSGDDATDKQGPVFKSGFQGQLRSNQNASAGATSIEFDRRYGVNANTDAFTNNTDSMVGYTFVVGPTTHTVTSNSAFTETTDFTLNFSPGITSGYAVGLGDYLDFTPPGATINPSSDLGVSDGDSIGYFLCGAGYTVGHPDGGAPGGRLVQGTAIISNASTDLVITAGVANGGNSTISGGLTLSSGDGVRGWGGYSNGSNRSAAWSGIMGYGAGGTGNGSYNNMSYFWQNGMPQENSNHGWGAGAWNTNSGTETAYDGAVLIFY